MKYPLQNILYTSCNKKLLIYGMEDVRKLVQITNLVEYANGNVKVNDERNREQCGLHLHILPETWISNHTVGLYWDRFYMTIAM